MSFAALAAARAQDEADFVQLTVTLGLSPADLERVRDKILDPRLWEAMDRWHARALEEIEREKVRRPLRLE